MTSTAGCRGRAQDLFRELAAPRPRAASAGCSAAPGQVESRHVQADRGADQLGQHRREVTIRQQPNGRG